MSEANLVNATRRSAELSVSVAAGAIFVLMAAATWIGSASAQQKEKIPDFSLDSKSAWLMISDNLLPPESGPGPVTFDKRYPYVDNREARRTNSQPTYRVADLTNPILKPWVVEQLKKANDWVLTGKVPFRSRERCYPSGVPSWVVYTLVQPIHILQTPTHVTMINEGGPEVRRIWLNVPHTVNPEPTWYGDSVGHYEGGDTLVVDTIGLTNKTFVDPDAPHRTAARDRALQADGRWQGNRHLDPRLGSGGVHDTMECEAAIPAHRPRMGRGHLRREQRRFPALRNGAAAPRR
jgi:hypothetical protein